MVNNESQKSEQKFVSERLLLNIIYFNSKFKATCKNAGSVCQYIRTHTKEKPSKISNITFAISRFYQKNTKTE